MKSNHYHPSRHLSSYVHSYWTFETSPNETESIRFATDGHPELFFNLKGKLVFNFCGNFTSFQNDYGILGQFFTYCDLDISTHQLSFFIKFHPAGLFGIFQKNMSAFTNSAFEVEELQSLYQQLTFKYAATKNIHTIIAVAEHWLTKRIHPFFQEKVVQQLLHQIEFQYKKPTKEILDQHGLSIRRLQQIFKEKTGLSPKQFQRMIRFRKAIEILKHTPQKINFISSLGYHDWSHFSKDMQYYFECSPGDFVYGLLENEHLINIRP